MAILRVAQMGHPVLRLVAEPVDPAVIPTEEFQRFLDDMLETLDEYDGAGLAAPQVYTSLRVVALTLDPERGVEFFINPVITPLSDVTTRTTEGCLSVEGLRGVVSRSAHIEVEALDRYGRPLKYALRGFPAVVTQHECDHLDGVLYVDRADPLTLAFLREYERFGSLDRFADGYTPPAAIPDEIELLIDPDEQPLPEGYVIEEIDEDDVEDGAADDAEAGDADAAADAQGEEA